MTLASQTNQSNLNIKSRFYFIFKNIFNWNFSCTVWRQKSISLFIQFIFFIVQLKNKYFKKVFCQIYFVVKYINHSVSFVTHIIILLEQQLLFKASDICNFTVFQIVNIFEGVIWIIYNMTYCNRFIVYERVFKTLNFLKIIPEQYFFFFHSIFIYIFLCITVVCFGTSFMLFFI